MKTVLSIVVLSLLTLIKSWAQNQVWSLPGNYLSISPTAVLENSLPTVPSMSTGYHGDPAQACHNAMQDAQGNLLFFIVDNSIYDGDGKFMDGLPYIPGKEIYIVPDPGNCQRYYLFYARQGQTGEPYYAILDLAMPNNYEGLGRLVPINWQSSIDLASLIDPNFEYNIKLRFGFAATKLRADNSRFVYVDSGANGVHRFRITTSGVVYDNYNFTPMSSPSSDDRSEVEIIQLANGNYRFALAGMSINGSAVYFADLDQNGDIIPSSEHTISMQTTNNIKPRVAGLEFSKEGDYLYFTHLTNSLNPHPIEYVKIATQERFELVLDGEMDFSQSQIELGKDNKIYFPFHNRLATLSTPNNPITSLWNNNAIPLGNQSYPISSDGVPYILYSYTMPDQIDGMDYTDHFFVNTACCLHNREYQIISHTQLTTATWNNTTNPWGSSTVHVQNQLVIPAGVTVTISNMTFKFAPGAKVVIERSNGSVAGGKLVMNNGAVFTVDNECTTTDMWLGVQVYGHSNQNQTPTGSSWQGQLLMNSGSRIENALKGAVALKYNSSSTYPYNHTTSDVSYSGGIIIASTAEFRNNVIDVEISSYAAPDGSNNVSKFTNCTFITNNLLTDPSRVPLYHIQLQSIKGVQILGCDFKNTATSMYNSNYWGIGIYSTAASYDVLRRCNNQSCTVPDPNVFENLNSGITAFTTYGANSVKVDRNKFINNLYGINFVYLNLGTITRNEFQVYRSRSPNLSIATRGVLLYGCTGYKVEENTFTEFNSPGILAGGNTYGVIVSTSGVAHNEIYKNTFRGIRYGCQAEGLNGEHYNYGDPNASNQGLQFRCNTFNSQIYTADISVTSGKIDYQQGFCLTSSNPDAVKSPAGNKFSHSTNTTHNDISANSVVLDFNYAHHADNITTPIYYNNDVVVPQYCQSLADPVYFHNTNSCRTKITDGIPQGFQMQMLSQMDSLNQIIDESRSQIALQSEQSMESETSEDVLQNEITFLKRERGLLVDEFIRLLLSDSAVVNPMDLVISVLQNEEGVVRKRQLCDAYLSIGDYENASAIKNQIVEDFGYDNYIRLVETQLAHSENSIAYNAMIANYSLADESMQMETTDAGVIAILEQIANDESDPVNALGAQVLLSLAMDTIYPFIPEELYLDMDVKSFSPEENMDNQSILSIYPNPSDRTMVTIQLYSSDENVDSESYVEIFSVTGQLASKKYIIKQNTSVQVDTSDLATGVYVVKLFSNNQLIETKKLMIQN